MNGIASKIIGIICMLGVLVAIGWFVITPIIAKHDEQMISEARKVYDREASMQQRQETQKAELDAQIAEISAEKLARIQEFAALTEEKTQLEAEIARLVDRRVELIAEMNDRAEKNREAYVGRQFERFEPGNGRVYENVEVTSVSDEGIKLRNDLGLRTVRAEDMAENFQIRFRFGLVPGDKPLPEESSKPEE